MPSTRPAGPVRWASTRIVSPGPQPASRQPVPGAGSGRVIVVAGPAGIGKSTLLAAAGATARTDGAVVLRARCSPLEQHAAWGMARQLFDPLRARPDWDGLTVGAAGLAGRVLAPE